MMEHPTHDTHKSPNRLSDQRRNRRKRNPATGGEMMLPSKEGIVFMCFGNCGRGLIVNEQAFTSQQIGDKMPTQEELITSAYHEAGHAVIAWYYGRRILGAFNYALIVTKSWQVVIFRCSGKLREMRNGKN